MIDGGESEQAIKARYERERRALEREQRARERRARVIETAFRRATFEAVHAMGKGVAQSAQDLFGLDQLLGEERT